MIEGPPTALVYIRPNDSFRFCQRAEEMPGKEREAAISVGVRHTVMKLGEGEVCHFDVITAMCEHKSSKSVFIVSLSSL